MFSSRAPRFVRRRRRISARSRIRGSRAYTSGASTSAAGRRLGLQVRQHLFIGKTLADADGAVGEADPGLLALRREVDDHAFDVAEPAFLQTGQVVGDDLREHRQHALRQIDAGATLAGLAVQGAAGRGEVADVGDVDGQLPVAGLVVARHGHGVVEIAGVGRVDGDDQVAGEILAAVEVVFAEGGGRLAGFCLGVLGKFVG